MAHYNVRAADPAAATQKLLQSFANNGETFYAALDSAGVPFQPAVSVGGQQLLNGEVKTDDVIVGRQRGADAAASVYDPRDLQVKKSAEPSKSTSSSDGGMKLPLPVLIGIIVGSVCGGLLLFAVMVYFCCCKGRSPAAQEKKRQKEREALAKAAAAKPAGDLESQAGQRPSTVPGSAVGASSSNTSSPRMPSSKGPRPSLTGYATDLEDVAPRDHRDQKL